jgi:hypothetical protein
MTQQRIEFLPGAGASGPPVAPDAIPPPVAGPLDQPRWPAFATVAAWLAGAALAAAAPFATVYNVAFLGATGDAPGIDGWGRYTGFSVAGQFGAHGARYGVALLACSGVFVVLALSGAVAVVRPRLVLIGERASAGLAAGAAGLLIGISVALVLDVDAVASTYRAANRAAGATVPDAAGAPGVLQAAHLHVGACVWLAVAAAACSVTGIVANLQNRPAPATAPAAPATAPATPATAAAAPATERVADPQPAAVPAASPPD